MTILVSQKYFSYICLRDYLTQKLLHPNYGVMKIRINVNFSLYRLCTNCSVNFQKTIFKHLFVSLTTRFFVAPNY